MISTWLLLLFYLCNIHSRELSLQCWRCEVAVQSSEETGIFLDHCRAQFDFTQHTREDCDGKCWKSADFIDTQLIGNTTGNRSLLINAARSTLKSSRRCFSADELLRAAEKGINTSNGCRKVERDDKKIKEVCFCSDQNLCNNAFKLTKNFFIIFNIVFIVYLNKF